MALVVPEPMLAAPTTSPRLPPGYAAEPKWDGFRALLVRTADGRPQLLSRRGTDLSPAFPEIINAATALPRAPGELVLDGELVIWDQGRLDFHLLLERHGRRRTTIQALAAAHPANYIAFDLLHHGRDLTGEPYEARRGELEALFAEHTLPASFTLCPSSSDPDEISLWLSAWTAFGIEGLCFKRRICGSFRSVRCPAPTQPWRAVGAAAHPAVGLAPPGRCKNPSSLRTVET